MASTLAVAGATHRDGPFAADLADPAAPSNLVGRVVGRLGRLDLDGVSEHRGDIADALSVARRLPFGQVKALAEGDREFCRRERVQSLGPPGEGRGQLVEAEDGTARRVALAYHVRSGLLDG